MDKNNVDGWEKAHQTAKRVKEAVKKYKGEPKVPLHTMILTESDGDARILISSGYLAVPYRINPAYWDKAEGNIKELIEIHQIGLVLVMNSAAQKLKAAETTGQEVSQEIWDELLLIHSMTTDVCNRLGVMTLVTPDNLSDILYNTQDFQDRTLDMYAQATDHLSKKPLSIKVWCLVIKGCDWGINICDWITNKLKNKTTTKETK